MLTQMQNAGLTASPDRRREHRDDRRRASQGGNIAPPSPAVVRHNSKRKVPAPTTGNTPVQGTPHSTAAQVNVPIGTSPQQRSSTHHPYAAGGGYDYNGDDAYAQQQYGRTSPMISSTAAPPALSTVRARGGDVGVSRGEYDGQDVEDPPPKNTLLRILTCRCG
jgi:casein kinase 1